VTGRETAQAEHDALLAAIGSVLGMERAYEDVPIPHDPSDPPGRQVLDGAVDGGGDPGAGRRVAWVEDTVEGYRDGVWLGCEVALHVAGRGLDHRRIPLRHYNPWFGTDVRLVRFFGDTLVVVYEEKHKTLLLRVALSSAELRYVQLDTTDSAAGDVVTWAPWREDLVRHMRLPEAAHTVPLPVPPAGGLQVRLSVEHGPDGTYVLWADRERASEPGVFPQEWRELQVRRLRLPAVGQGLLPRGGDGDAHRNAVWRGLRDGLDGPDAPRDGADVLIATAGAPFWHGADDADRPSGTSCWWFAAVVSSYLAAPRGAGGAGRPEEADHWLAWLEVVAAGPPAPEDGWDPAWGPVEGAVLLGLSHIRRRAGQVAAACRAGDLPVGVGAWGRTKGEVPIAPPSVTALPEGFVRAWERIPDRFPYPVLNLAQHYG
jgi:hypothetical protein